MRVFRLVALFVLSLSATGRVEAQFVESEIEFTAPIESRLTLSGFAGTSGAVVLAGRSEDRRKHVSVHEVVEGGRVEPDPLYRLELSDEMLFFDAGNVDGERTLAFMSASGVHVLDAATGRLATLVEASSLYRSASSERLVEIDFLIDVNEDGQDDVVLPDFDGLRVFLQAGGRFGQGTLLTLEPRLSVGLREATYVSDPLHIYDFDMNGIGDLAVVRNNRFIVFDGTTSGFESRPRMIPIELPLTDDEDARFEQNLIGIDQSDFRVSRISRVVDLDGDALPDLITFTAISSGVFDKRSEYHVHLARRAGETIRFVETLDAKLLSRGFQVDLTPVDVDGDGRRDLVSTSVDFGFGELIKALFSRSLDVDIGLHTIGTDPVYSSEPDYRANVDLRFSVSTGFISNPAVRFADFNGDGLADLLLQDGTDRLEIRLGSRSDDNFGDQTWMWETQLPLDGSLLDVADANGDGRPDILMGFGAADGEGMQRRAKVLISRPVRDEQ